MPKMHVYFSLYLLQFCTNTKPTLIHHVRSDAVEMCVGSHQLIRILNRLGYVSSPDTHDRFVTEYVQIKHQTITMKKILRNAFTVALVDDFDMLQVTLLFIVVISNESFMVQQYSWINLIPTEHLIVSILVRPQTDLTTQMSFLSWKLNNYTNDINIPPL